MCRCIGVCVVLRGDLGLHEDEDEDEDGWQDAGTHHPHRKLSVGAQRRDEPITLLRRGHREATGHAQFLGTGNRKPQGKYCQTSRIYSHTVAAILVLESLETMATSIAVEVLISISPPRQH